jgi:hypothetical protein
MVVENALLSIADRATDRWPHAVTTLGSDHLEIEVPAAFVRATLRVGVRQGRPSLEVTWNDPNAAACVNLYRKLMAHGEEWVSEIWRGERDATSDAA